MALIPFAKPTLADAQNSSKVSQSQFCTPKHNTSPEGSAPLAALTRAGIAHLWFESIHPFEDGNGRIGRAIAESALARAISTPTFSALSKSLLRHRKAYYAMLEAASTTLAIDFWLSWFADRALDAQRSADELVRFLIE